MRQFAALGAALLSGTLAGCGALFYSPTDADSGSETADSFSCLDATFFGNQPEYNGAGTIYGRIASPSGEVPVAGAEILIADQEAWAISAEGGCFFLTLPAGTHSLSAEKGRYSATESLEVTSGQSIDVGKIVLGTGGIRVAVIKGEYDSVEILLSHIGVPYDSYPKTEDVIDSDEMLAQYDAVFANCGSDTSRSNTGSFNDAQFTRLRAWIEAGGTLYTSDWEYSLFEGTVPEALSFASSDSEVRSGSAGSHDAAVLSRDLISLLGSDTAEINFDLPGWAMASGGGKAETLVEADIDGATRPLAALYRLGDGRAVFTSFHNESQVTSDMQLILYELILAL